MALVHSPSIITKDLILYYDFGNILKGWYSPPVNNQEIDGANIVDISRNLNEIEDGTYPVFAPPFSQGLNESYGCLSFESKSNHGLTTMLNTSLVNYSVSVWFCPNNNDMGSYARLIYKHDTTNGFSITYVGGNWGYHSSTNEYQIFSNSGMVNNNWNNIAISSSLVSGIRKTTLYFNGIVKSSSTGSGAATDGGFLIIGNNDNLTEPYSGFISNVMVYARDLTDNEIYLNYISMKSRFGL